MKDLKVFDGIREQGSDHIRFLTTRDPLRLGPYDGRERSIVVSGSSAHSSKTEPSAHQNGHPCSAFAETIRKPRQDPLENVEH